MCHVSYRSVIACVSALGLAALVPAATGASAASSQPAIAPVKVDAGYRITLNGFDLGTFSFKSDVGRGHYTLDTDVQISAMLGVFHWKGVTRTSGLFASKTPKPRDFHFEYESSVRNGSIAMGFDQNASVDRISILPVMMDAPDTVPLERSHLANVFDPLSAIMQLTHTDAPKPCGRKVSIFDGRQRFDIALRYAREMELPGTKETAIVCRVKYTPIAGYRNNDETRRLAATNEIEIAFRPVPSAKLMLPQSVTVPTGAGTARIDLERVSIELPESGKLASVD